MVTVSGKALGRKQPLFADFAVPLPPELTGSEGATLRDLISAIVRAEVAAFNARQSERRFVRALTSREITAGAEKGKIEMGGDEAKRKDAEPEEAVDTALVAFEDGLYLVVIDGQEERKLESQIYLQPDSRVTFVRLTLLAGG